ncbi:MAG: DUF2147 domain-containing protein [Pseudomonadota bacterium]
MLMKSWRTALAALGAILSLGAGAQAEDIDPLDVLGVWYTEGQGAQVEIVEDGDSVKGTIIWFDGHEDGATLDVKNPDPELRDQPILGLAMLSGFERGRKKWRRGRIYDPESGKSYRSAIFREGPESVAMQGCIGILCVKQKLTKVPEGSVIRVLAVD